MRRDGEACVGVVIPIFNVEPYLEECLTSVAEQTLRDLDVVMVDDGSTDASAEIAARFAARDPRFRLVRQPNGGLGRARNVGVRHVRGKYLTFVDSDDVVPAHAYELMADTLERTGSDLVSGNTLLLTAAGTRQSPMHRRPMGATRLRTHISRDPTLMYDRLAPNKMFRRRFWDEHGLRFPEGVLYEDIPVTIPAHFLASSVDVLNEPVYHWRQRDGGDLSITQRRTEIKALTDRFAAVDTVRRFLDAHPEHRAHKRAYDKVALRSDLRIFLNVLPDADEAFRARFLELGRDFLARTDPSLLDELPAITRLKWYLVGRGLLPELLKVLEAERLGLNAPVVRRLHRRYRRYPFWRDRRLRIPRRIFQLREELAIHTRLYRVDWRRGKLHVTGHAYVDHVGAPWPWSSVKVAGLREESTGRTRLVPAWNRRSPGADVECRQARYGNGWAGFSFTLNPKVLRRKGRYEDGTWLVAVGVYGRGVLRRGALAAGRSGSAAHPPYRYVTDDVRIIPLITPGGTLRLKVETVWARVTAHRVDGGDLEISGTTLGRPPDAGTLVLRRLGGTVAGSYPVTYAGAGDARFTARIPLRHLVADAAGNEPADGVGWRIDLVADAATPSGTRRDGSPEDAPKDRAVDAGSGERGTDQGDARGADKSGAGRADPVRVVLGEGVAERRYRHAGWEIVVSRCAEGYVRLYARTPRPVIDEVVWRPGGTLVIAGAYEADGRRDLVLSSRGRKEERVFALTCDGERFHAELPVTALHTLAGVLPLRAGKWDLRIRAAADRADGAAGAALALKLDHALLDRLPAEAEVAGRRYVLQDDGFDRPVLEVHSDLRPGERGPHAQRRTRIRHYRLARRVTPLRPAVLFDSYTGKQYSDSPRAIHEELVRRGADLDMLWVVRDAQVDLPDTARPVRLWGSEWYEALARSRYVVTNAHLPAWFRRRDGQVVMQTWHGTPLKRIGFDIDDVRFANAGYLEKLAQEVRHWTYLVSPNRFSTPILRRAFRYEGEIIETGYPRNDVLRSPDRDVIADDVRRRLGLPADRRAALYAPTWRDDRYYGPGRYRLDLRLDLKRAAAALGDDWVLLIRRHPNVVDTVRESPDGFVRDVSDYPDIAELFLVADALITDYSSLMFDYAVTGRPMLFFTYDLEHYRDELRGFYFDFERQAPGPLLTTSDEVIDALGALDEVSAAHRDAYTRFAEQFCDLDDGKAAGRVVDRLLGDA